MKEDLNQMRKRHFPLLRKACLVNDNEKFAIATVYLVVTRGNTEIVTQLGRRDII